MDRDLAALRRNQHDDLEQVPRGVRADDESAVWVSSGVFDCQRMVDCVEDVSVGDAVLARRVVNLHPVIVIRKGWMECFSEAAWTRGSAVHARRRRAPANTRLAGEARSRRDRQSNGKDHHSAIDP